MLAVDIVTRRVSAQFAIPAAGTDVAEANWPRFTATIPYPHVIFFRARVSNADVVAGTAQLVVIRSVLDDFTHGPAFTIAPASSVALSFYRVVDNVLAGEVFRVSVAQRGFAGGSIFPGSEFAVIPLIRAH